MPRKKKRGAEGELSLKTLQLGLFTGSQDELEGRKAGTQ